MAHKPPRAIRLRDDNLLQRFIDEITVAGQRIGRIKRYENEVVPGVPSSYYRLGGGHIGYTNIGLYAYACSGIWIKMSENEFRQLRQKTLERMDNAVNLMQNGPKYINFVYESEIGCALLTYGIYSKHQNTEVIEKLARIATDVKITLATVAIR